MSLQSHPATPPGPRPGRPNLLIGDVEREWVCRALSDHFTAGRLTPAEFDDRVEQAVAARTDAVLRGLLNDLPTPTPAAVASTSGGATAAANATPVLDVLSIASSVVLAARCSLSGVLLASALGVSRSR